MNPNEYPFLSTDLVDQRSRSIWDCSALDRIDSWYEDVRDYTFETISIPLRVDEAKRMAKYYEEAKFLIMHHQLEKQQQQGATNNSLVEFASEWDDVLWDSMCQKLESLMSAEELQVLSDITARIDPLVRRFAESHGGAFVKLSSRSPKDAALYHPRTKELLAEMIRNSSAQPNSLEADIEDMCFFTRAISQVLCVRTGEEAMRLLLRSSRASDDVSFAELMTNSDSENLFQMHIVIRAWCIDLLPEWEFRSFVINNQLCATTQYYPSCFVPEFVSKKQAIQEKLYSFWQEVAPKIKAINYTIDIVLSPDLSQAWLVEINAPPPSAGGSLFNWQDKHDCEVVQNGPYELRILESYPANAKAGIQSSLRKYIHQLRGTDDSKYCNSTSNNVRFCTSCDRCHIHPISKTWYHCHHCGDYDLCMNCYSIVQEQKSHNPAHSFLKEGEDDSTTTTTTTSSTSTTTSTIKNSNDEYCSIL